MNKIPFDIKFRADIESGKYKVETRYGKPARIICWDKRSNQNEMKLVVLIDDGKSEHVEYYRESGTVYQTTLAEGDLFLVEKKALSPVAQRLSDFLKIDFEYFTSKEWDEEKWNETMETQAAELVFLAKLETLVWRKWHNGACGNGCGIPIAIVKQLGGGYKLVDSLGVGGEEYIMLSDLEKLPTQDYGM